MFCLSYLCDPAFETEGEKLKRRAGHHEAAAPPAKAAVEEERAKRQVAERAVEEERAKRQAAETAAKAAVEEERAKRQAAETAAKAAVEEERAKHQAAETAAAVALPRFVVSESLRDLCCPPPLHEDIDTRGVFTTARITDVISPDRPYSDDDLDTEPLMFYTGRRFQQDNEYREFLRRAGTGVRRFRVMHVDGWIIDATDDAGCIARHIQCAMSSDAADSNCMIAVDPKGRGVGIFATRIIDPGEELVSNYVPHGIFELFRGEVPAIRNTQNDRRQLVPNSRPVIHIESQLIRSIDNILRRLIDLP